MSIAKIRLDESRKLEFGVSVTGAESTPTARFVIEGKDFSISYPCHATADGIEVEVGQLKNILPSGEYPVRLEVVIENKIYTPFSDMIVLEPAVQVHTKPRSVRDSNESVKVDSVHVSVVEKVQTNTKAKKIANLIAEALAYQPEENQTESEIINESLAATQMLSKAKRELVVNMLAAARNENIQFDETLIP